VSDGTLATLGNGFFGGTVTCTYTYRNDAISANTTFIGVAPIQRDVPWPDTRLTLVIAKNLAGWSINNITLNGSINMCFSPRPMNVADCTNTDRSWNSVLNAGTYAPSGVPLTTLNYAPGYSYLTNNQTSISDLLRFDALWSTSNTNSAYMQGTALQLPNSLSITYVLNIENGKSYRYPASIGNILGSSYLLASFNIGGNFSDDPGSLPPQPALPMPNCSTLSGVSNVTYNLGTVQPDTLTGILPAPDNTPYHSLVVNCQGDPATATKAATATLSVQSNNGMSQFQNAEFLSSEEFGADDYIALRMKLQGGMPPYVTPIAPLTKTSQYMAFSGTSLTPQWSWALPASSAGQAPTTPAVIVYPELYQVKPRDAGYQDGQRTYRITYSVVIQ
jgi:hypothetical protein